MFALVVTLAGLLAGLVAVSPAAQASTGRTSLTGLFRLTAGTWSGGVHGTYFRMLQPDGKTYLSNTSSKAGDTTYTLLSPGTDGGLRTGAYQSTPSPAFASNGDALSGKVTAPTDFFGVKFATATNKKDPQTGDQTTLPVIYADGTALSGNLSAFAASWNNQNFNQGSPKPNGTTPGFTQAVSGTYSSQTRAFSLTWRSLIVGGPFNDFTGEWHLVGTFVPSATTKTPTSSATPTPSKTPTKSAAATTHSASATKSTATGSSAASSPVASKHASPSLSATPSATVTPIASAASAATSAAAQAVTKTDATTGSSSNAAPWLIGGIVLVVALGLIGFWLLRIRPSRT